MSYVFQSTSENHPSLRTPDQKAVLPDMLLFLHRGAAGRASTEQQRSRGRERERQEGRRGSDRPPLLVRSIPSPDLCHPLSLHTKSTEIGGDVGELRGTLQSVTLFTSVPNPSLPSCPSNAPQNTTNAQILISSCWIFRTACCPTSPPCPTSPNAPVSPSFRRARPGRSALRRALICCRLCCRRAVCPRPWMR